MINTLITIYTQAYNVEEYIVQCIESVLNQTYMNFEWILIDNGSTDDTRRIIQEYAQKDNRIKRIRFKTNTSQFAQDIIINFGRGKYVVKIDSDDWIAEDYLEKLINNAETKDADIVCCKISSINENTGKKDELQISEITGTFNILEFGTVFSEITSEIRQYWAKLMRMDLFIEASYQYEKDIEKIEQYGFFAGDTLFMLSYFESCKNIVIIPEKLYFYRIHSKNSTNKELNINRMEHLLMLFKVEKRFLNRIKACSTRNMLVINQEFWLSLETILKYVLQKKEWDCIQKIETIGDILTDKRVVEIREEFPYGNTRKILSKYIAWCYMNLESECYDTFIKILWIIEPALFSKITEEQYMFLLQEKTLLSLIILGEYSEAKNYLYELSLQKDLDSLNFILDFLNNA